MPDDLTVIDLGRCQQTLGEDVSVLVLDPDEPRDRDGLEAVVIQTDGDLEAIARPQQGASEIQPQPTFRGERERPVHGGARCVGDYMRWYAAHRRGGSTLIYQVNAYILPQLG